MTKLRCQTCLYEAELLLDGTHKVSQQGGTRQPSVHPTLAAWRVIRKARSKQGPPVVSPCPMCAQPLVCVEGEAEPVSTWTLTTPAGDFVVAAEVTTPNASTVTDTAANDMLEDLLRERMVVAPAAFAFQSIILTMGLAPFFLWLGAVTLALWMFTQMMQGNLYR